jgi:hypothetical protein
VRLFLVLLLLSFVVLALGKITVHLETIIKILEVKP